MSSSLNEMLCIWSWIEAEREIPVRWCFRIRKTASDRFAVHTENENSVGTSDDTLNKKIIRLLCKTVQESRSISTPEKHVTEILVSYRGLRNMRWFHLRTFVNI